MERAELNQKWEQTLDYLTDRIQKYRVDLFFGELVPQRFREKDSAIVVFSNNPEISQINIDRYKNDISDATQEAFGRPCSLVVSDKKGEESFPNEDQFDPRYTFDSFVEGENSRLAFVTALTVAEGYNKKLNPLFIYGGSGLGKTHLMHAIGQYVRRNHPKKKVLYISSETFTNEYVQAVGNKTIDDFRKKYRTVDILMIDDIQFIAGKAGTVNEIFNTFETLTSAKKQIVLSSDKPPKDLGDIPERLTSRFAGGMIVDIQIPDYETRVAILHKKAEIENIDYSDPGVSAAIDLIAQGIQTNIRELESAFNRVITFANLEHRPITKDYAKSILTDVYNIKAADVTPDIIKEKVAEYFGISTADIESAKRSREIAYPRQIAIYLSKEKTNYSLEKIAEYFGNRNHTTIMYSHNKVKEDMERDPELRSIVERIEESL
ncbi:MAG: chromosomal replication initiator protein DnaA [Firmicutes bacterium]|nr:chromosomal replication initiator protein DnaA [Bacillota bacterium]